jgi:probable F420-dependent oxidoreductase
MNAKKQDLFGRIGVWNTALRTASDDPGRHKEVTGAVAELESLGYGTVWLGGSPSVADAAAVVDATERITVATGILSLWEHTAEEVAAQAAELDARAPGRFVLGIGVSHGKLTPRYAKPYTAMTEYLDGLDAAGSPAVGASRRVLAALGPRMLKLSADRALGAHPYLVPEEHVRRAREVLGPDAVLAPELKVVVDTDLDRGRATARSTLAMYLQLPNYTSNLLRLGFEEADFAEGGSDRLVDALFAVGDVEHVKERIEGFLTAGADHVALQPLTSGERGTALPRDAWRELADALGLRR